MTVSSLIRLVAVMVCPRERCQGLVVTSEGERLSLRHRCMNCGYQWYEDGEDGEAA